MIMRGKEENFPISQPEKSFRLLALFFHHPFPSRSNAARVPEPGTSSPLLSSPLHCLLSNTPIHRIAASISSLPPPSPSPADQFSSPHQTVVAPRHAIHPRLGFRISGYFYRCPYPLVHPPDSPRSGESETRGQKSRDVNLRSALFCRERTVYYDGKRTSAFIYPAIRRTETIRFGFRYPAFDSRPFRFRDLRFRNEIVARQDTRRTEIRSVSSVFFRITILAPANNNNRMGMTG